MLKGHVFSRQLFGNPIFALFINTFLNGANGISDNYKNGMALSHSATDVTVQSGAVCIQGRFVEEDSSSTVPAGNDTAFCKLVIEIDLDQQNTESELNQVSYKILKGANTYPNLTQTNIVKNNSGIYQYELARFKTTGSEITDFQDMRTFLDFDSIYTEIQNHIDDIDDGSLWLLKTGGTLTGDINFNSDNGFYWKEDGYGDKFKLVPDFNGFGNDNKLKLQGATGAQGTDPELVDLVEISAQNGNMDVKGEITSNGSKVLVKGDFAVLTGSFTATAETAAKVKTIAYPTGFNKSNCVIIAYGRQYSANVGYAFGHHSNDSAGMMYASNDGNACLAPDNIELWYKNIAQSNKTISYKLVLLKIS